MPCETCNGSGEIPADNEWGFDICPVCDARDEQSCTNKNCHKGYVDQGDGITTLCEECLGTCKKQTP